MKVAVGVIADNLGRLLITQRPHHTTHAGFWEFPGGKLLEAESGEAALIRELKEEIGIDVEHYRYLGEVNHQYNDKTVKLLVYFVDVFSGQPRCLESQLDLQWVYQSELEHFQFPAANDKIIEMIQSNGSAKQLL